MLQTLKGKVKCEVLVMVFQTPESGLSRFCSLHNLQSTVVPGTAGCLVNTWNIMSGKTDLEGGRDEGREEEGKQRKGGRE